MAEDAEEVSVGEIRCTTHFAAMVLLVASLGLLATAHAAEPSASDQKRAKELFDAALALMDNRKHTEACPLLEQSQRLDPGMGTQYYLARCYENTGRLASASSLYGEVAAAAKQAGMAKRERVARRAAKKLAPRIPKLVIQVPAELAKLAGFELSRDGEPVARDHWGKPRPVDLGDHAVKASAPGRVPWDEQVKVPREGATVTISVPLLEMQAEPAPPTDPTPATPAVPDKPPSTPGSEPQPEPDTDDGGWTAHHYAALGTTVLGVGGLVLGAVFGAEASSQWDEALTHCRNDDPNDCDAQATPLSQDASDSATISTVSFVAGGALAATAVVLWATAPWGEATAEEGEASWWLAPLVDGEHLGGAVVVGRF